MMTMKAWLQWILMVGACCVAIAADAERKPTAKDVASAYFEALVTGEVKKANELSAVPFSFDRKEVLTKKEEVEAKHAEILGKKGKREVPKYTTTVPKDAPQLDPKVFPKHSVVRIVIEGDKEHIDIYVTTEAIPKVIGFSD